MLNLLNLWKNFEFRKYLNQKFKISAFLSCWKWFLYPAQWKSNMKWLQQSFVDKTVVWVGNLFCWNFNFKNLVARFYRTQMGKSVQKLNRSISWIENCSENLFISDKHSFSLRFVAQFFRQFLERVNLLLGQTLYFIRKKCEKVLIVIGVWGGIQFLYSLICLSIQEIFF